MPTDKKQATSSSIPTDQIFQTHRLVAQSDDVGDGASSTVFHDNPQVCVLEVAAIVLHHIRANGKCERVGKMLHVSKRTVTVVKDPSERNTKYLQLKCYTGSVQWNVRLGVHLPVTLLHDGNLLDDFLQIGLDGNLLDGHHLTRLLMDGLKHAAIGTTDTNKLHI